MHKWKTGIVIVIQKAENMKTEQCALLSPNLVHEFASAYLRQRLQVQLWQEIRIPHRDLFTSREDNSAGPNNLVPSFIWILIRLVITLERNGITLNY